MKSLHSTVLENFQYPEEILSLIPPEDFVLFDIETTGLSHSKTHVILIGYIVYENSNYILHQIFCENRSEEVDLLKAFQKVLESKTYCITYNGRAFDIPYLNSRYKHNNIPYEIQKFRNLDIMRLVKRNRSYFEFEDFKLKTVEKFLGIQREDTISGKESVELYIAYEISKSRELEEKILLHNYEDILYLLQCLEIVKHAQTDSIYAETTNTIHHNGIKAFIVDSALKGDKLIVNLYSDEYSSHDHYDYSSPVTWAYDSKTSKLEITCPLFTLSVDDQRYQFLDVDLIQFDHTKFNQLSYTDKMQLLIAESKTMKYLNIYRTISRCFEHFR